MDVLEKIGTQIAPNFGYVTTWEEAYDVQRKYETATVSSFALQKTTTSAKSVESKFYLNTWLNTHPHSMQQLHFNQVQGQHG